MPFLRGKRKFGTVKAKVETVEGEYFDIERELTAVETEVQQLENKCLQSKFMEAIKALGQMNRHLDSIELALAK